MRSTVVRADQVRGLLRLCQEAREIGAGDPQRRHLVQGIARLVGAPFVTILVDADFGPGRRGAVVDHAASYVDGPVQRMFDAMATHGTTYNPGARALMARLGPRPAEAPVTLARRELLRDPDWYDTEFVAEHQRACGLDDFVYSVQLTGRTRVSAVTTTRGLRDRAFDVEDVNLVGLFHEEYTRIVGAPSAVLGAPAGPRLAPREREVLGRLLTAATEKEIAEGLAISRQTVHGYVKTIYAAHGVSSRAELLVKCLGARAS
jgi:DNA-binding CsgD family transcriptional regulator